MCNGGPCKTKEERLAIIKELANTHPTITDTGYAINLDGFTTDRDKLMDVWAAIHFWPVISARILFPKRPKRYVTTTESLGNYACNKAVAMRCRLSGDIQAALNYEKICDMIHKDLPTWARW